MNPSAQLVDLAQVSLLVEHVPIHTRMGRRGSSANERAGDDAETLRFAQQLR